MRLQFTALVILFSFFCLPVFVFATETEGHIDDIPIIEDADASAEIEVPSTFDMLLLTLKEQVSLWLTFDEKKEIEKRLDFAQHREKLAQYIIENSDDAKKLQKAYKLLRRADKLTSDILELKAAWTENPGEEAKQLLGKISDHYIRRENILDALEAQIPDDALEKFQAMREGLLGHSEELFRAIYSNEVPEEVKGHLKEVKDLMIDKHAQLKTFREERRQLLKDLGEGLKEGGSKLEALRAKHREYLEQVREARAKIGTSSSTTEPTNVQKWRENLQDVKDDVQERTGGGILDGEAGNGGF